MRSCKLLLLALFCSCTAFAQGPTTAPAAPTSAAEDVISLFSDAYADVAADTYLTDWSVAALTDTVIDGTNMKRYSALDFAGIEMTGANAIDLTGAGMTHLHLDFWSANSTTFRVKLVDFGGDGFEGANADTEAEIASDLANNEWVSIDLPLADFAGMNQSDLSQFIISSLPAGMSDVYLANVYFYDSGMTMNADGPVGAPAAPSVAAEDVISLFSDTYTDVPVDTYLTDWSSATLTDTMIAGTNMKRYSSLDFAGIEMTGANAIDLVAAGMTHLHLDLWTANSTTFRVKLVDFGGDGFEGANADTDAEIASEVANREWVSLDLRLSEFAGMNQNDISQFIISSLPVGTSNVYLTNIYFYIGESPGTQMDLPVSFDEEGVDYGLGDFEGAASMLIADPEDATNTVVQTIKGAGAATFAGTTLTSQMGGPEGFASPIPFADGATTMSVRVWSPTANTPVMLKVEKAGDATVSVETLTNTRVASAWDTLVFDFSVPRTGTASINLDTIYEKATIFFDFGNSPAEAATYYWDNVEFGGVVVEPGPMTAAPTPTREASEVISLYSDAYDDVPVDTYFADFSTGRLIDTLIEGNATLLYEDLNFAGIETLGDNAIDLVAAGMTHLHLNVWSANSTTFRTKLVDFGGDGFGGDNDTEFEIARDLAQGEWVTVEYPLPAFAGMNQDDVSQLIISSLPVDASNVYIDNIYFYQGEALGAQMDLPVTFEEDDVDYGINDFAGAASAIVADPEDATNTVVETTKTAGAATFAGTTLTSTMDGPAGFASAIPFAAGATTMSVRVWSPTVGTPVMLKVEKIGDPTVSVETLTNTVVAGAWDTLVFDFSVPRPETAALNLDEAYGLASIFFDFGSEPAEAATYYWDNVEFGGVVIEPRPMTAAPTPTRDAADVISLFSDAYTDVPVNTFFAEFSTGAFADTLIEGNPTLFYQDLNFAGIETLGENALDVEAAEMTHLHMDVWSANSTTFRTKLVDFGGDGFGNDNDTEFEIARNLPQGEWVTVEYPLPAFVGMNQTDISQIIISSLPVDASNVFIDNIYFYKGEPLGDQMTLPVTFEEEGIDYGLQDFEGAVSMLVADPEDMTNTVAQTTKTAGAATFAGTTLTSTEGGPEGFATRIPLTAENSTMTVRVWSPTAGTPVMLKVEKIGDPTVSVETLVNTRVASAWDTLTFDFNNERTGTAAANYGENYGKATIFFDFDTSPAADATYYWDDVQFGGAATGGDDEPMEPAPTPTRDAANVISMFSDAYTDVTVDTWLTDWSMAALEDIEIAGNATKKYTSLDFAGVETVGDNALDLTTPGMTHLHVDYWTPNMDTFRIKLVDFGMDGFGGDNDTENEQVFMTTKGEWVGLDIPLEDFAGMNQTDVSQFIISGLPAGLGTIYLDNVYYYKDVVDGTNTPVVGLLEAFPNPTSEVVNITAPVRMDRLTLFNINGQVVGNWAPNAERFEVEMGHLPKGNYVALVSTSEGLMTIKLLKQ